jgi:hypothetical protein
MVDLKPPASHSDSTNSDHSPIARLTPGARRFQTFPPSFDRGGLVVLATQPKDSAMPARSLALALLLLLFVMPAGVDAEPAGETVMLQLPPTMSPEAVRGLIADLAAKGARPAEQPADPPPVPARL